jgi:hypothetical protein
MATVENTQLYNSNTTLEQLNNLPPPASNDPMLEAKDAKVNID